MRRADRLSLAAHGRRRAAPRPLRLRRRGAHHRAGGALRRAARSTPSPAPATPRRRHSPASSAPYGRAARTSRRRSRWTRRSSSRRSDALVPAALRAVAARRHGGVRRHPHERRSRAFPTTSCGASASLRSVANLTRADGEEFLALAPQVPVRTTTAAIQAGGGKSGAGRSARRALAGCRGAHGIVAL